MSSPIDFYSLTPERILDAVERSGLRCTGRCLTLNSMENRVYEVEIEIDDESQIKSPSDRFRVVKFYRPGRWSREQILEEHQFLADLREADIPVVAPLPFKDGATLDAEEGSGILFTVFPKQGGRSPDELTLDQCEWIGRLLARMHIVGGQRKAQHRPELTPTTYGSDNLKFLIDNKIIPPHLEGPYLRVAQQIVDTVSPWFEGLPLQRIHGDCHLGNLLWASAGPFWVDFDDMVRGPCVQDLWLMLPGRVHEGRAELDTMLEGYEQMRAFDRRTLRLIEPLRALRLMHYTTWIARRWADPAFKRTFDYFGSEGYWQEQTRNLEEQLGLIG